MRKSYLLVVLSGLACFSVDAQVFSLSKDINEGTADSYPNSFCSLNTSLIFQANDGVHGAELWKSDGTTAGTIMIKDINPGAANSNPMSLVRRSGSVYFQANDGVHGDELWKTDGTEAGTVMVKDINPGSGNSAPSQFLSINNILFFSADNGTKGTELWKTDGTVAGTVMVKDINVGTTSSHPLSFENLNGTLYLSAIDASAGRELWRSDGTSAGTWLVKDIIPGTGGSFVSGIRNANGMLLFVAGGAPPTALWKSDGTAAGTVMIKGNGLPEWLTVSNGALYFTCFGDGFGTELWKSDGTIAGTVMVKDLNPGPEPSYPSDLTNVNGTVFFLANSGTGNGLWKTDGTEAGTVMLLNHPAGALKNVNGILYFGGSNGINGVEIWKSDGTGAGTIMVQDIAIPGDGSPWEFDIAGAKLFASVTENIHGRELWVANLSVPAGGLPLTMLDFKGHLNGNNVDLNWKTVAEQNTSHFDIERSIDGRNFTKTGTINASGNSSAILQYSYIDRNITALGASVVYYKLKMKDTDGKFTYSKIIAINISSKVAVVMLYPNPAKESATLMIAAVKKENILYRIIDQNGKTIQRRNITVNEGSNMIVVETNSLAAGVYTLVLNGESTNTTIRLIKQ